MLKISNGILCIIVILVYSTFCAAEYSITISPIFKNEEGQIFISTEEVYGQSLQTTASGKKGTDNEVIKPSCRAYVKTKACLVATVKKNGQPVTGAEIVWILNSFKNGVYGDKVGDILYWGDMEKSYRSGNMLITTTLKEPKTIMVQVPRKTTGIPVGSGRYSEITLSPGQSFIEIVAVQKGQTEITAYLPEESNPARNTVFSTVAWIDQAAPSLDLAISDEGAITFLAPGNAPSYLPAGEEYIGVFDAVVTHKGGKSIEDIFTVQIPENWIFPVAENNPDFLKNFVLIKNNRDKYTGQDLEDKFYFSTGEIKNKKYASVKIYLEPEDKYVFKVKARPSSTENPSEAESARIYNATAMLMNSGIFNQDPITLKRGREVRVDKVFSGLNTFITEYENNDPIFLIEKDNINYKAVLESQDFGIIKIDSVEFVDLKTECINSFLKLTSDGRDIIVDNYLAQNNKPFFLKKRGDKAVIDFTVKAPGTSGIFQVHLKIKFEIYKTLSDGTIKTVKGETTLSEATTVYE